MGCGTLHLPTAFLRGANECSATPLSLTGWALARVYSHIGNGITAKAGLGVGAGARSRCHRSSTLPSLHRLSAAQNLFRPRRQEYVLGLLQLPPQLGTPWAERLFRLRDAVRRKLAVRYVSVKERVDPVRV